MELFIDNILYIEIGKELWINLFNGAFTLDISTRLLQILIVGYCMVAIAKVMLKGAK